VANARAVGALERLVFGAIGMTALALASAGDGAGAELTLSQWRVLVIAGEEREGKRVGEIAARIGVSLPAASRQCRRLERRGLVIAERDETDRRATVIRLSPAGLTVREDIIATRHRLIEELLDSLPRPPTDTFLVELEAVATAFERYR
jgi:DNA-binding MarR family transcriptional regulator